MVKVSITDIFTWTKQIISLFIKTRKLKIFEAQKI